MVAKRHAIVAGASVAGLASACSLTAAGWDVAVLERRPDLMEGGRALLLQPNGLTALDQLGALDLVRERGRELSRVAFYGRGGRKLATYDYGELRHPQSYLVEIRPADLRAALAERLAVLGGEPPRLGCEVDGLTERRVRCGEDEFTADLVVGADGPGSIVREALGIDSRRFGESDGYVLGTPGLDSGAEELAVHCGPGYADGVVPLRGGTYFWNCITEENRAAVAARDLEAWRNAFAHRLPAGSELPGAVGSWDELTTVRVRPFWARRLVAEGAVLVGDAAGAVHPHAAQGANLALEDAVALGDGNLERYANERGRRRRRMVLWSLLAAPSLDAPNLAWRAIRRSGFAWNRVGPMRRLLLRRQAGVA